MSAISSTYSFVDTAGSLTNPILGNAPIVFAGEIGMGEFEVEMTTPRTTHDKAADGTIMPSYIAGDNGRVRIKVQQTSVLYKQLLGLYNALLVAAATGDVSNWANSSLFLRNTVDGSQHICEGVSFEKIPNKTYGAEGAQFTWDLMACSIQNLAV
jgi:hypothetical protein